ncbi:MAG: undecaprenyl-phosphate glucose phosphotransferase [Rhizobiales bacterium]|nr:undecaprenyl-phosphate glucose phosphotransferase [Hyphomicrobiales bacterium]
MVQFENSNGSTAGRILAASISDAEQFSGGIAPKTRPHLSKLARKIADEQVVDAISPVILTGLVRITEFILIFAIGMGVYFAYVFQNDLTSIWIYLILASATSTGSLIIFQVFDLYNLQSLRRYLAQAGRLGAAWTITIALTVAGVFLLKMGDNFSRVWLVSWYITGLLILMAGRMTIAAIIRYWTRQGRLERRAVIVGGGENGADLISALESAKDSDIRICGVFDDRSDDRSPAIVAGYPKLGTVSELVEFGRQTRIDLLIVSIPIRAENRVLELLKKLWVLPVDIRLSAHTNKLRFRPRSYSYIGNVPFLDVFDKPLADWDFVMKSLFDRVIGALMLITLAPVMAAVAIAVRMESKGPALFRQKRYGFNNELIEIYKFRSMYVEQSDASASKLVTKNDSRVTKVGRFIRKTSLDELPQLFNVVFHGNLSLIGPRPHAVHAKAKNHLYDNVVDGYFARHRVKPGITGWAQVNGWRGETDTDEKIQRRVEHDLYYIENWSLLFDFQILFMTPFSLLNTENAY